MRMAKICVVPDWHAYSWKVYEQLDWNAYSWKVCEHSITYGRHVLPVKARITFRSHVNFGMQIIIAGTFTQTFTVANR